MPIYEYQCEACEKTFEVWQKISEAPVKKCPECGAKKVSRLISQSSFHLKGGGWYVTDYGKGGSGKDAKKKKGDGGEGTSSSSSGSDAGSSSSSSSGGSSKAAAE